VVSSTIRRQPAVMLRLTRCDREGQTVGRTTRKTWSSCSIPSPSWREPTTRWVPSSGKVAHGGVDANACSGRNGSSARPVTSRRRQLDHSARRWSIPDEEGRTYFRGIQGARAIRKSRWIRIAGEAKPSLRQHQSFGHAQKRNSSRDPCRGCQDGILRKLMHPLDEVGPQSNSLLDKMQLDTKDQRGFLRRDER